MCGSSSSTSPEEYAPNDLEPIRSQLRQPGWDKIVGVTSRRGSNVDVHLRYQGDTVMGLAIVAADPTELTVVNIVGSIDLEKSASSRASSASTSSMEKAAKGKRNK